MTKQVQRRRGTATQHTSFTGAEGELSVNTTNKSVHVHDGSTAGGIELARKDGSNVAFTSGTLDGVTIGGTTAGAGTFTNLTATGTTTLAGASTSANITFGDNDKAIFGAGSDLQIYHSGGGSFISEVGTGNLFIQGESAVAIQNNSSQSMAIFNSGADVQLRYATTTRLATTSTGIDVTGTVTADGLTVDGSATVNTSGTTIANLNYLGANKGKLSTNGVDLNIEATANLALKVNGATRSYFSGNGDISFYEDTGTTAKFFWDAADERLGIGTSSPDRTLDVNGVAGFGNGTIETIISYSDRGIFGTQSNHDLEIRTNATERMRIDSSGNLLVGTTSQFGAGLSLNANNTAYFRKSGDAPLTLRRDTSDGSILNFFKGTATVGSIGVKTGRIYIGSGDTALYFNEGTDAIQPVTSAGATRNGYVGLGDEYHRFKDLYLSGGVYLGGTGSANKLDDYEEGTFTPVMTGVSGWDQFDNGYYTKVGNMVYFQIIFSSNSGVTGTASNIITGLPFSNALGERNSNVSISRMYGVDLTNTDYIAGVATSQIQFGYVNGDNNTNNFTYSGSTLRFTVSGSYRTNS